MCSQFVSDLRCMVKNNEHNFKITRAESQESLTAVIDAATADMSPERFV